ncbi:MAG: type II toxin-antitoxin system VapC family toxin [Candidatus Acidiferrales bacterium]
MTAPDNGIVIDASVALAWCFPDEASGYADAVLIAAEGRTILVPSIWAVEISDALLVGERRKRIRQSEVRQFVELLKGLDIAEDRQPFADTWSNVLPLAREQDLSAYDAAYLDVAVRHGAPLATLDAPLQKACRATSVSVFKP